MKLNVTLVQMCSTDNHQGNIEAVKRIVQKSGNSDLIALPEASGMMNKNYSEARKSITTVENDPFVKTCQILAKETEKWIHIGSTPVREGNKYYNCSVLLTPQGKILATYNKIHLFDVFLEGKKAIGESQRYTAGDTAVMVDTPWGPWGLSICYDLRFPGIYREYCQKGASIIFIPSAFTIPTGKAHWEVLLRARAIENGAWVIAAAQVGNHDDGRSTFGHSMIVNPWGEVIADLGGKDPCQENYSLDLALVESSRKQIPSLVSGKDYAFRHLPDYAN
ncbi:MAG: carbon-nitrogen hydrolase family protein [Rhodobacteraceae bacterium]|nr:carbon-nitrogen hydrolase family protein [Paracoccaceae bacterium]